MILQLIILQIEINWYLAIPIAISLLGIIFTAVIGFRGQLLSTEIEKLKTENQKELHIHQAQYDKEYSIYVEIWELVFQLNQSIPALRPIAEIVPVGISNEEHLKRKIGKAAQNFNSFLHRVESNKPFYAPSVYIVLNKMMVLIRSEINDVQIKHIRQDKEYFDTGEKNTSDFLLLTDELCEAIRHRTSHSSN